MTKKKKAYLKILKHITLLAVTVMLFTYVSYSWIRREWTPSIEQTNIKIVTSGALVFQMGEGSGYSDSETINEILGIDDFELKPVSNCTGKSDDFFALNFNDEMGWEKYEHLSLSNYPDYTTMGKSNGYLEFNFVLYAPGESGIERFVYLDEAYIRDSNSGNPSYYAECVRVSITNKTTNETLIFCIGDTENKTAITNEQSGGQYIANGALYYEHYDPTSEANSKPAQEIMYKNGNEREPTGKNLEVFQKCINFSEKNGKTDGKYDKEKTLFSLDSGNSAKGVTIVVRVWLEGADPKCQSKDILEPEIDLKLKFSSFTSADLNAQNIS